MDWMVAAWVLMESLNSAWVAVFNGAVVAVCTGSRVRHKQPVSGKLTSKRTATRSLEMGDMKYMCA